MEAAQISSTAEIDLKNQIASLTNELESLKKELERANSAKVDGAAITKAFFGDAKPPQNSYDECEGYKSCEPTLNLPTKFK